VSSAALDESPAANPPAWFERLVTAFEQKPESPFRGMSAPPPGGQPRSSAVLVLFGTGSSGDDLLLTQRASTLRSHPGQVAFPGGRIDTTDDGPAAAALREANEESGLDPSGVLVRALGPRLYLAVTDYYVTPVLAWWQRRHELAVGDPAEVDRVVLVRLSELINPARRFTIVHPSGFRGPAFSAGGLLIWGFTAGVITWMLQMAGLEQEWDADDVRSLEQELRLTE
jgi:8-oxo-dGTP pyrophosphatase MutT (NUDIX family)